MTVNIEDYTTSEIEMPDVLTVNVNAIADVKGYAEKVCAELDDHLAYEIATRYGYVKERTCRMEYNERKRGVYCSNCGERMDMYTCDQYGDGTIGYSYPFCCECGAMVVEE